MSLILLFLPHGSAPPPSNQGAFTTAVISSIEIIRPTLSFVQKDEGEFTVSTETYNGV